MVVVSVDIKGKVAVVEKFNVRLVVISVVVITGVVASVTGSIVEVIGAAVTGNEVVIVCETFDLVVSENAEVVERVAVFLGSVVKAAS